MGKESKQEPNTSTYNSSPQEGDNQNILNSLQSQNNQNISTNITDNNNNNNNNDINNSNDDNYNGNDDNNNNNNNDDKNNNGNDDNNKNNNNLNENNSNDDNNNNDDDNNNDNNSKEDDNNSDYSNEDDDNNEKNINENNKEEPEKEKIIEWINQIKDKNVSEKALKELTKKRESFSDLALYLWYSTSTISSLLKEITYTYQFLSPPKLSIQTSNKICNILSLFQCIASHSETKLLFLAAKIPIFLYPFLKILHKNKQYEYLRLTTLGVIGALVKGDNSEVISFLIKSDIFPLCLKIMRFGSELSKTVSTFIIQKILLDSKGLKYICNDPERFYAITIVFYDMIGGKPSQRLIKHIIRSYARLADYPKIRSILKISLPLKFKDEQFISSLDDSCKKWMNDLMKSVNTKICLNPLSNKNNNVNFNSMRNQNLNQNYMNQGIFLNNYVMNNNYKNNNGKKKKMNPFYNNNMN